MALALGVSVASATCTLGSSPIFCDSSDSLVSNPDYTNTPNIVNGTQNGTKPVAWQEAIQDSQTYYRLTNVSPNDTTVSNLLLYAGSGSPTISYKNSKYEIGGLNGLILKSNKGILVNDGTGTLGISIWDNDATSAESFTLDLTNINASSYAVYANVDIEGGHANNANNTFTGKWWLGN